MVLRRATFDDVHAHQAPNGMQPTFRGHSSHHLNLDQINNILSTGPVDGLPMSNSGQSGPFDQEGGSAPAFDPSLSADLSMSPYLVSQQAMMGNNTFMPSPGPNTHALYANPSPVDVPYSPMNAPGRGTPNGGFHMQHQPMHYQYPQMGVQGYPHSVSMFQQNHQRLMPANPYIDMNMAGQHQVANNRSTPVANSAPFSHAETNRNERNKKLHKDRRDSHNIVEKRYRENINIKFALLEIVTSDEFKKNRENYSDLDELRKLEGLDGSSPRATLLDNTAAVKPIGKNKITKNPKAPKKNIKPKASILDGAASRIFDLLGWNKEKEKQLAAYRALMGELPVQQEDPVKVERQDAPNDESKGVPSPQRPSLSPSQSPSQSPSPSLSQSPFQSPSQSLSQEEKNISELSNPDEFPSAFGDFTGDLNDLIEDGDYVRTPPGFGLVGELANNLASGL